MLQQNQDEMFCIAAARAPELSPPPSGTTSTPPAQPDAAPPTPLEVGMIEVTVRVMLRVEIGQ